MVRSLAASLMTEWLVALLVAVMNTTQGLCGGYVSTSTSLVSSPPAITNTTYSTTDSPDLPLAGVLSLVAVVAMLTVGLTLYATRGWLMVLLSSGSYQPTLLMRWDAANFESFSPDALYMVPGKISDISSTRYPPSPNMCAVEGRYEEEGGAEEIGDQ